MGRKLKHKDKKDTPHYHYGGEELFCAYKNSRFGFYTAKAHFLIIPRFCIKLGKIISLNVQARNVRKATYMQLRITDFYAFHET